MDPPSGPLRRSGVSDEDEGVNSLRRAGLAFLSRLSSGLSSGLSSKLSRGVLVAVFGVVPGCATALAVGRGGPVYQVRVATVNGSATALQGPVAHPACVLQVG